MTPSDGRPDVPSDNETAPAAQAVAEPNATPLLSVRNLSVEFATNEGWLRVAEDLNFDLEAGESLGLAGESGSGKTVTGLAIMGLIQLPQGRLGEGSSIRFQGQELVGMRAKQLNRLRGDDIVMIFQEPMASLNPAFTVGHQIAEVVRNHKGLSKKDAWRRAEEMLEIVNIPSPKGRARSYPHQFSGGMAQRAMIAMALANDPKLLIADEPTTALDVTVEADVLDTLRSLQREFDMGVLLITHDLGVIESFCNRAIIMYAGQIVAGAPVEPLFAKPLHPYVEGLIGSIPNPKDEGERMWSIPGTVPPPSATPEGCHFHPRCNYAEPGRCTSSPIALEPVGNDRLVRCVRADELDLQGIVNE